MDLSVIIPVFNEEKNIQPLFVELKDILYKLGKEYEVIFVDDGSTDNTAGEIKKLRDKSVKLISHRANKGKSAALTNGFREAKGRFILTLDGDLQDDPHEIPNFFNKLSSGYDLVVGWKKERKDPITKRFPSKIFNFLVSILTGVWIHDSNCGFKLFKREVMQELDVYGELHRYIPALTAMNGFKITEVQVEHRRRKYGKSKYGVGRLVKGFLDLVTVSFFIGYRNRPMHLFGSIGLISFALGLLSGLYLLWLKYVELVGIGDRPLLLFSVVCVVIGIQFISLGLLAELIVSLQHKIKR